MGRYEKHFDYAHTCPEIDRQIEGLKSDMMKTVKTYLSDIEDHDINYSNLVSDLYMDIEDRFEAVRSTNANMRDEGLDQEDRQLIWMGIVAAKDYYER